MKVHRLAAALTLGLVAGVPHPSRLDASNELHAKALRLISDLGAYATTKDRRLVAAHAEAIERVGAAYAADPEVGARSEAALKRAERRAKATYAASGGPAAARRLRAVARRADPVKAAARATAAGLAAATGIRADDEIWGAPFRHASDLFEGSIPAEALGVSAKFRAGGGVSSARYHVALVPPCECWAHERGAVVAAARSIAAALGAPAPVAAWIDAIEADDENGAPLPSLGFGVSRDDGAAKVYVLRGDGSPPPALPLAGPPPAPGDMLSLEWKVGGPSAILRRYNRDGVADAAGPAAEALLAVGRAGGYPAEAVAVSAPLAESLAERAPAATKVGLKITGASDDGALLASLEPVFAAAGVEGGAASAAAWAAETAPVGHAVSNVQAGPGYVTLYRHPTTFGHADAGDAVHARLLRAHAAGSTRGRRRRLDAAAAAGDCGAAADLFREQAMWGGDAHGCKDARDALGVDAATCPAACDGVVGDLLASCGECGEVWAYCESPVPEDHDFHEFTATVAVAVEHSYDASACDIAAVIADALDATVADDAWAGYDFDGDESPGGFDAVLEGTAATDGGYELTVAITGANALVGGGGGGGAAFLAKVKDELLGLAAGAPGGGRRLEELWVDEGTASAAECAIDAEATEASLHAATVASGGTSWSDVASVSFDAVPDDKKWRAPYGSGGLMEDMVYLGDGCGYPNDEYWPSGNVCDECASLQEGLAQTLIWGGPCGTGGGGGCHCDCRAFLAASRDACAESDGACTRDAAYAPDYEGACGDACEAYDAEAPFGAAIAVDAACFAEPWPFNVALAAECGNVAGNIADTAGVVDDDGGGDDDDGDGFLFDGDDYDDDDFVPPACLDKVQAYASCVLVNCLSAFDDDGGDDDGDDDGDGDDDDFAWPGCSAFSGSEPVVEMCVLADADCPACGDAVRSYAECYWTSVVQDSLGETCAVTCPDAPDDEDRDEEEEALTHDNDHPASEHGVNGVGGHDHGPDDHRVSSIDGAAAGGRAALGAALAATVAAALL